MECGSEHDRRCGTPSGDGNAPKDLSARKGRCGPPEAATRAVGTFCGVGRSLARGAHPWVCGCASCMGVLRPSALHGRAHPRPHGINPFFSYFLPLPLSVTVDCKETDRASCIRRKKGCREGENKQVLSWRRRSLLSFDSRSLTSHLLFPPPCRKKSRNIHGP